MSKYIIGHKSGVYKCSYVSKDIDSEAFNLKYDDWFVCEGANECTDWHYEGYKSKGVASFNFGKDFKIGSFTINRIMRGNWKQENDYGSSYSVTYGCEVADIYGNKAVIVLKGQDVDWLITKLLNRLVQIDKLEDYFTVESVENSTWERQELADKICNLAEVIKLYKKYKETNPATSIVADMESLIESRLKDLMKV